MCEIKFNATQVAAIYNGGNLEARAIIKEALGDKFSTVLPIMERVKTFEDACKELGDDNKLVRAYNSVKYGYSISQEEHPDLIAYLKLRIITAALNEGWEPQFTEDERRWYGWYDIIRKDDYDNLSEEEKKNVLLWGGPADDGSPCGLACASSSVAWSYSYASVGSRLAFKSAELAEYAAKQFVKIYADFCFIPSSDKKD